MNNLQIKGVLSSVEKWLRTSGWETSTSMIGITFYLHANHTFLQLTILANTLSLLQQKWKKSCLSLQYSSSSSSWFIHSPFSFFHFGILHTSSNTMRQFFSRKFFVPNNIIEQIVFYTKYNLVPYNGKFQLYCGYIW